MSRFKINPFLIITFIILRAHSENPNQGSKNGTNDNGQENAWNLGQVVYGPDDGITVIINVEHDKGPWKKFSIFFFWIMRYLSLNSPGFQESIGPNRKIRPGTFSCLFQF